jgi:hypothetical protein
MAEIVDRSNPAFNALAEDHARLTQEIASLKTELADLRRKIGEWAGELDGIASANWFTVKKMREEAGK